MKTLNSKSDELNPTQDFKSGFIILAHYSTTQINAMTPGATEYRMVFDNTVNKVKFFDGTGWQAITST